MIQGKSALEFGEAINSVSPKILRQEAYQIPLDIRGNETFKRLVDESSPIFIRAA